MSLIEKLTTGKKTGRPPKSRYATQLVPHPLKKFFSDRGVVFTLLAREVDIHFSTLSNYLSGRWAIPQDVDDRLRAVAEQIQAEEKAG